MQTLREIIEKHTVVVLNKSLKPGFTLLPNYILKNRQLSHGARLAYAVLLSYAWQEDSCFPGQVRMAEDLGTSDRSIRTFLRELKDQGFITWEQRGLNKSNIYYILEYKPLKPPKSEVDRKPPSGPDRKYPSVQKRKPPSDYEYAD